MAQTHTEYPVMEVAVLVKSYAPHANERSQQGDIVSVHRPHHALSRIESALTLRLLVEGLELHPFGDLVVGIDGADSRRYAIPIARLKQRVDWLDLARVLDASDAYQPFIPIDTDEDLHPHHGHKQVELVTGLRIPGTAKRPLTVHGLVFDKKTGRYL